MCRLIETIQILDGRPENLFWHNLRLNDTRQKLFGSQEHIQLEDVIRIPAEFENSEIKCRISYGREIERIEYEPYIFRKVNSLKIVYDDTITYSHKYSDRSQIAELFTQRGEYDDILIVKNEIITDSSFSNVVLSDGIGLFTPLNPLLHGTKRAKYISEGLIRQKDIQPKDLHRYKEIHLINAFLDLGRCVISVGNIYD